MIYSENILICIAVPLLVVLPFMQSRTRKSIIALLVGMVMCLLGAYLNGYFAAMLQYDGENTAKYIAPIVEEIMKMIPILVGALLINMRSEDIPGFAATVGAGFATYENCCYITQNGAQLISFVLIRGLAVGVMHVLCGLTIGVGVMLASKYRIVMIPGMMGTFAFAMTIHALYNLLVSAGGIAMYVSFCIPIVVLGVLYLGKDKIYGNNDTLV